MRRSKHPPKLIRRISDLPSGISIYQDSFKRYLLIFFQKEPQPWKIEREFLNQFTADELLRRLIRFHLESEGKDKETSDDS